MKVSDKDLLGMPLKIQLTKIQINKLIDTYLRVKRITGSDVNRWHNEHYTRGARLVKKIVNTLGSIPDAMLCINELGEYYSHKGFDWTLQAIVNNADNWKVKRDLERRIKETVDTSNRDEREEDKRIKEEKQREVELLNQYKILPLSEREEIKERAYENAIGINKYYANSVEGINYEIIKIMKAR